MNKGFPYYSILTHFILPDSPNVPRGSFKGKELILEHFITWNRPSDSSISSKKDENHELTKIGKTFDMAQGLK